MYDSCDPPVRPCVTSRTFSDSVRGCALNGGVMSIATMPSTEISVVEVRDAYSRMKLTSVWKLQKLAAVWRWLVNGRRNHELIRAHRS